MSHQNITTAATTSCNFIGATKSYENTCGQVFSIRLRVYECGVLSLYCYGYCNDIAVSQKFSGSWSAALKIRKAVARLIQSNLDTSETEVQHLIDEMCSAA